MNLTGSGGSGKSFVLDATKSLCKQFCKAIGKPFNDPVFMVTATTNTAAAQLKGDTIHSIARLQRKLSSILKNWSLNWVWVKILLIDEISMMGIMVYLKLDKYLHQLMAQFNPEALNYLFGGLNIIFCGDFSQLNPVGKKGVIYDQSRNALWGMINRVVNLTMTNWRYLKDPQWGNLLQRMHHGESRREDRKLINSRVIGENCEYTSIPRALVKYPQGNLEGIQQKTLLSTQEEPGGHQDRKAQTYATERYVASHVPPARTPERQYICWFW